MTVDITRLAVRLAKLNPFGKNKKEKSGHGVIIGKTQQGDKVHWPISELGKNRHLLALGMSGVGKTVFIGSSLVQELVQNKSSSMLIIDPKADLIEIIIQGLAATAPERLQDIYYLNPFEPAYSFPFNLIKLPLGSKTTLSIRALQLASLISQVSTAQGSQRHLGTGARQIDAIYHLVLGALATENPQASLLWALDALIIPQGMKRLASLTTSSRAKLFLQTARLNEELRASCASRMRIALAATDELENLLTATTCVDFAQLLEPNKICLVDLSQPPGGLQTLQQFFANIIARLAFDHLLERPSPFSGHCCRIVIDEAQLVAPVLDDCAENLLCTGRSKGISLSLITQGTVLIQKASDTLLRTILANTPKKYCGRLSAADAELLAREQSPKKGTDERISTIRQRFSASITNLDDREFYYLSPGSRQRFITTEVDMLAWKNAAHQHEEEIQQAKTRIALPTTTQERTTLADVTKSKPKAKTNAQNRSRSANRKAKPPENGSTDSRPKRPRPNQQQPDRPRSKWG